MKKPSKTPVPALLRLPPPLLKKLDAAARSQSRSRNAEACLRLSESFKAKKPMVAEVVA
ncbi:Arc family DNA-binding protein [Rhodoferax sp. WC2427]|uniref:Arc family DNA-binding protein n=1 Tax=Rhodoferax sp. WC2427 TaxID=3234144 RepID=UPI0034662A8F